MPKACMRSCPTLQRARARCSVANLAWVCLFVRRWSRSSVARHSAARLGAADLAWCCGSCKRDMLSERLGRPCTCIDPLRANDIAVRLPQMSLLECSASGLLMRHCNCSVVGMHGPCASWPPSDAFDAASVLRQDEAAVSVDQPSPAWTLANAGYSLGEHMAVHMQGDESRTLYE